LTGAPSFYAIRNRLCVKCGNAGEKENPLDHEAISTSAVQSSARSERSRLVLAKRESKSRLCPEPGPHSARSTYPSHSYFTASITLSTEKRMRAMTRYMPRGQQCVPRRERCARTLDSMRDRVLPVKCGYRLRSRGVTFVRDRRRNRRFAARWALDAFAVMEVLLRSIFQTSGCRFGGVPAVAAPEQ
jgi:hypothetical protein